MCKATKNNALRSIFRTLKFSSTKKNPPDIMDFFYGPLIKNKGSTLLQPHKGIVIENIMVEQHLHKLHNTRKPIKCCWARRNT